MYTLVVTINGNWSQFGTGFGQLQWLGSTGSGYSIDEFFTYDNGVTTLQMSNPAWDTNSPNASFRLYGALVSDVTAVPEPSTVVFMVTGLLGLGAMVRARRQRQA
jgi:hypothetical protein